jgi:hypothetical protein
MTQIMKATDAMEETQHSFKTIVTTFYFAKCGHTVIFNLTYYRNN